MNSLPMKILVHLLCLALWIAACANQRVFADDLVADYFSALDSFQARFIQTVIDSDGERLQHSEGTVWIEKPGRFRWDYQTPYRQLIVADGKRLWTYDEDLEQATVKPADEALSSTPAMLLSGFRPLSDVMTWRQSGTENGERWFILNPIQPDSSTEKVRIGFVDDQLSIIEVTDSFGNHTRIQFSQIKRNQPIDPGLFRLDLPAGTDIIGSTP
ncbi:MAG: outer membrane lipoprotein chaperone LolA [Pseudomonadota bacterium]|nr:outer membrane lipoprotein chaperone LolA [Pseudomonadota bacterium]